MENIPFEISFFFGMAVAAYVICAFLVLDSNTKGGQYGVPRLTFAMVVFMICGCLMWTYEVPAYLVMSSAVVPITFDFLILHKALNVAGW